MEIGQERESERKRVYCSGNRIFIGYQTFQVSLLHFNFKSVKFYHSVIN